MIKYKRLKSWVIFYAPILIDLCVIIILGIKFLDFGTERIFFFDLDILNNKKLLFVLFSASSWLVSTYLMNFYKTDRNTSEFRILTLLLKQFLLFSLITYTFIGIFRSINIEAFLTLRYLLFSFFIIGIFKITLHFAKKKYAVFLNRELKNVIIVGNGEGAHDLHKLFKSKKDLGFKILEVFNSSKTINKSNYVKESLEFIANNSDLDEIYCAIDELEEEQINEFVKQASLRSIQLKFIPDTNKYHTKRLTIDYYNYLPVLSIKEVALNNELNQLIKRAFDILLSAFIVVFVLSWLTLILGILIKLESKGPIFYKHIRNGINYKEFLCYKFRSLRNLSFPVSEQVIEDDSRVTKIGKFIRRTSIDELPQFFNVLLGDMSVVGPRPHMLPYTNAYSKKIDKYEFTYRHTVKPGVTGLAQIKGYRGEVKNDDDIIKRIKYDVFYIENWNLLLDIKIIIATFLNVVKGEDNAY